MADKIAPCLCFDFRAEEAVHFYLRTFGNGRILRTSYYGDAMPQHCGKVMLIEFELFGRAYQALNVGPQFKFSEALSLSVDCEDQAELDRLWAALTAEGGIDMPCGWVKDRFGLSWQLVPRGLLELTLSTDPERARRAMAAMMTMKKIDLAAIRRAVDGGATSLASP
jgi:predicted 3-demethylubiquinone-9 3-methyltransferase (glyoxalase superfamily)